MAITIKKVTASVNLPYRVSAVDTPSDWKATSFLQLTGVNDDIQLQSLINTVKVKGGRIELGAGTYQLSNPLLFDGGGNQDAPTIEFVGQGVNSTILNAAINKNGINLTSSVSVVMSDFAIQVDGTGHGINSNKGNATSIIDPALRGFWLSDFSNIKVVGGGTHSGYAFHLGSPFRSTFSNLEAFYVANGIRLFGEDDRFNPGDCTFQRTFMELVGGVGKFAYKFDTSFATATTFTGFINHVSFDIMEGIAGADGSTFMYLGGFYGTQNSSFKGVNIEQFKFGVDLVYGTNNKFDFNYIVPFDQSPSAGAIMFRTSNLASKNYFTGGNGYITTPIKWIDDSQSIVEDRNIFDGLHFQCDGGTITYTGTKATQVTRCLVDRYSGTVDPIYSAGDRVNYSLNKSVTYSASTTLDINEVEIIQASPSGNIILTLPPAAQSVERKFTFIKIDATANTVTVKGSGAELINASNTTVLTTANQTVRVWCNGTKWFIV